MKPQLISTAVAFALLAAPSYAKVSAQEAQKLKTVLTPVGAERAGNTEGTIPAWDGGLKVAPSCYQGAGTRYCDPFPDDKPLFTITAANAEQYKAKLSAGQLALFKKYGGSYKMNVYPTRRTVAYPEFVYEATYKNALNAELQGGGESLHNAVTGVPFPIPKNGFEPIWNHKVRYRGRGGERYNEQAAVMPSGDFNLVRMKERARYVYNAKGAKPQDLNNVLIYFIQIIEQPPRLAGTITLVHETMDQVKEPRRAWQYNPGQRRLRRAPNVGYDNPGTGSDGLRTNDQFDAFNGAMDRYSWKLKGKKEMFIPYNAYEIHSDKYKVRDILKKGHINSKLARYELHRVWVVEAELKSGTSHIHPKRFFYVDEDSWHIALADNYDQRGQLWRVQEAHDIVNYDKAFTSTILETVYDLHSGRYLALSLNNEDPENTEIDPDPDLFQPSSVQKQATK